MNNSPKPCYPSPHWIMVILGPTSLMYPAEKVGFAATSMVIVIGVLIKNKIDRDKALEAEGTAILRGLEEGLQTEEDRLLEEGSE